MKKEEKGYLLFKDSSCPAIVSTLSGKILFLNARAKKYMGSPKTLQDIFGNISKKTLKNIKISARLEKKLTSNGSDIIFFFRFFRIQKNRMLCGLGFEATNEILMKKRLKRQFRELKLLDIAKTNFLSISSHELRSPITPMKGQLQMLLKGYFGTLNRKQRESLEVTLRNVIRLDDVIINLLEMSRIEAGRLKLEIIDTDLQEEFERLRIEMKHLMEEKHVNIMFNTENLGLIPVDSDRIIQVLRILINNAIKFSPQRGDVKVKVEKNKNEAIFSVQDFGRGIEKEKQKKIFQAFYQAEETMYRKYGGIGLGLSIAKGIVEALGGKIWFESKRGKGTTFYFTVMLKPIKKAKPIKMIKPIKLLK